MRIHPILPLLLSTVAGPSIAGEYSICLTASDSVSCIIEQAEFARQRNAEIDASIERVARARARELAMSVTNCKSHFSQSARCLAERARRFAEHQNELAAASIARVADVRAFEAARNAEIEASIARVADVRAFEAARNAEIAASIAAVEAQRTRRLEIEQNALIEASIAAANAEREHRFAANQNALATASAMRVASERRRQLATQLSPCASLEDTRPRCEAQRARDFAAQQRQLAAASVARVKAGREQAFAAARNAEVAASIAAVERTRAAARLAAYAVSNPHCAESATSARCASQRTSELQASLTHCKSAADTSPRCVIERERDFTTARNQEINRSVAAVAAARARGQLAAGRSTPSTDTPPLETGAIGVPPLPNPPAIHLERNRDLHVDLGQSISTDPCQSSTKSFEAVHFTRGAAIEDAMKGELDRLASLAQACPGLRIEVHGYADGAAQFNSRALAQARAQTIADYLIAAGVAPNRVSAIGRGSSNPSLPTGRGLDPDFGGRAEFVIRDAGTDAAARRVMWDLAELLDPRYIPAVANLSP